MLALGNDEQRFIRHAGDSCVECVALASLSWHKTGSTPEPGERICRRKCKCGKEYRTGEAMTNPVDDREGASREGWKRQEEEARREAKKSGRKLSEQEDWDDPNVLAYYGGGQENATGPDLISRRLMGKFREHTIPGEKEFGAIVDRSTGEVLYMREGTRAAVQIDQDIVRACVDPVVIHTHDLDVAFSGRDWQGFLENHNQNAEMLVTKNAVYSLVKTSEFDATSFIPDGGGQILDVEAQWYRRFDELKSDEEFLSGFSKHARRERAIIERINKELGEQYNVAFKRHKR